MRSPFLIPQPLPFGAVGHKRALKNAKPQSLEAKLAAELGPLADRFLLDEGELDGVAGVGEVLKRLSLFLRDRLVVAELDGAGTIVAGTHDDVLHARIETEVDEKLLYILRVLEDQEILGIGVDDLLGNLLEVLLSPHERLLTRSALVGFLEHGVRCGGIVDCNKAISGVLERPTCNCLTVNHTVIDTDERNHGFLPSSSLKGITAYLRRLYPSIPLSLRAIGTHVQRDIN